MSEVKIPGPAYGLNEIVDAYTVQVIEKQAKENLKKFNPLRPSSAGKCERELGYEYMEYLGHASYEKEPKEPSVHRLLNLGHSIEYHAIQEMKEAFSQMTDRPIEIKYKQQVVTLFKLDSGRIIEGSIDLWLQTDLWKCIADLKSVKDKYSQFYKSSWDEFVEGLLQTKHAVSFGDNAVYITDLEKFLEAYDDGSEFFSKNLYQLNSYGCSSFAEERGVTFCSIMQYNKNDSRLREIRFVPSKAVAKQTELKFKKVASQVETHKSVENLNKDYTLGSSRCAFCQFRKHCWPEADSLTEYFKTFPKKEWSKDIDRLPKDVQKPLEDLFKEYTSLNSDIRRLEQIEQKIISMLDKIGIYKVRLKNKQVYYVKKLKSGGPGGGERLVLRRGKD